MRRYSTLNGVIRLLLALVFIFSGFVKGVDPWGTAIKLDEYFQAFGLEFLSGGRYVFSVLLSATEMWLGFCLLFRLGGRLISRLILWVTIFFTALTLVLALWNPVSDCGCFGDAVKLTHWQTFYKNLVLLLFAVWTVRADRPLQDAWCAPAQPETNHILSFALGFCFLLFSFGVGLYSLRHLPIIDFLPYKVGVKLSAEVQSLSAPREAILIYRDRTNGQLAEFSLQDTTWQDSTRWEFVDTRFVEAPLPEVDQPQLETVDFSVFDEQGDVAAGWLASKDPWFLITLSDLSPMDEKCQQRYADLLAYAHEQAIPVYAATAVTLPEDKVWHLGTEQVPLFNIDGTMLKSLIRAHRGLVLFQDGTLLAKWNCRDIPRFSEQYAGRGVLSMLAEAPVQARQSWLLGVMIGVLAVLYVIWWRYRCYLCRRR